MHKPAQPRGDGWGFFVPHIGVANKGYVTGQFGFMRFEERDKRGRAGFLFALNQERGLDGKLSRGFNPSSGCFHERHQLAFVVGCAATIELAPTHFWFKRFAVP